MLEFRRLTPELANAAAVLFAELRAGGDEIYFHPHPLDAETAQAVATLADRDLYYLIVDGDIALGYGLLRGWDAGYQVPSLGIALAPAVRGTGLAQAFMHFLHAAARFQGALQVRLKVYPANTAAYQLYYSLGYRFSHQENGQWVGILEL